ncbi:MAG: hypothetical protein HY855_00890 [Burkholderiales bacterium]|nr:hypothetical protein [Burkholderiales bacterium]
MSSVPDVARIRLDNALLLFDEFVQATVSAPDAATLRGLERRFAERLQIQPSYWSQIKGRSRQIGERLARQFEQLCRKPHGWMDQPHGSGVPMASSAALVDTAPAQPGHLPQDDDERFIVGLVLTYYRRHPQRARTRLLDLLGEVLTPPSDDTPVQRAQPPARPAPAAQQKAPGAPAQPVDNDLALWARSQSGVAPLKRKR